MTKHTVGYYNCRMAANPLGTAGPRGPPQATNRPEPSNPQPMGDRGPSGPLAELAEGARQALGMDRAAGKSGQGFSYAGSTSPGGGLSAYQPGATQSRPTQLPSVASPSPPDLERSYGGGRLFSAPGTRPAALPVALKVQSSQGAAIAEEWTEMWTVRFSTTVRTANWKKTEHKTAAEPLARSLDVARDSGLDVTLEPHCEVMLRELAALWFQDRTADKETADYLRESSEATFGLPRSMWLEAKEYRKLTRFAGSQ